MRRVAPLFLCLLLAYAGLCPAFCLVSEQGDQGAHSCCHHKRGAKPCGHSLSARQAQPSIAPLPPAMRIAGEAAARIAPPARVMLSPSAGRIDPSPPKRLTVLRI
ncbi:MAG: hypothetical protein ABSB15_04320 [Bryobacteraceae bacterium]